MVVICVLSTCLIHDLTPQPRVTNLASRPDATQQPTPAGWAEDLSTEREKESAKHTLSYHANSTPVTDRLPHSTLIDVQDANARKQ